MPEKGTFLKIHRRFTRTESLIGILLVAGNYRSLNQHFEKKLEQLIWIGVIDCSGRMT